MVALLLVRPGHRLKLQALEKRLAAQIEANQKPFDGSAERNKRTRVS
jgi:hypothetical protein